MNLEPATNWYGTRRHLSADLKRDPYSGNRGRRGLSLCSTEGNPVDVRDQDWLAGMAPTYPHLGRIVVADLPLCKRCERVRVSAERSDQSESSCGSAEERSDDPSNPSEIVEESK